MTLVAEPIGRTLMSSGPMHAALQCRRVLNGSVTASATNAKNEENTMSTDQNKVIARRIVDESWTKHNPSILDELFTTDAVLHDPSNPTIVKGPQGAKSTLNTYLRAFPDMKISIEREIAEGDYVVQHLRAIGTNTGEFNGMPATGKKTEVTGVVTSKIKDGKVVEAWSLFDNLTLMQQLGVVPTPQSTSKREPELVGAR